VGDHEGGGWVWEFVAGVVATDSILLLGRVLFGVMLQCS
jgi:hypothetical protein